MTNWSNFATLSDPRVTAWGYDLYSGLLRFKTNAGASTKIEYTDGSSGNDKGHVVQRKWARGSYATYTFNNAGENATITHSVAGTPSTTITYDRVGRVSSVAYGNDTTSYAYNALGLRTAETYSGSGTLGANGGLSITSAYDSLFRRTAVLLTAQSNATPDRQVENSRVLAIKLAPGLDLALLDTRVYLEGLE